MQGLTGYIGLFIASFLASTLLPAASELGLSALYLTRNYSLLVLVCVASVGNTLGSIFNWLIGRFLEHFKEKRWFPANRDQLQRAQARYHKYGYFSLLLSWVPVIGDPITLVAGIMREPLWRFVLIVAVAKTARYIILAWIIQSAACF